MKISNHPKFKQPFFFNFPLMIALLIIGCSKDQTTSEVHTSIKEFYPPFGEVGSKVIIEGQNFSTDESANIVNFGELAAEVVSASEDQLKVIVPEGAADSKISVTVNGRTVKSIKTFNLIYTGPTITNFKPKSGKSGTDVILEGTNFSDEVSENIVMFGKLEATIIKCNEAEIKFTIPEGAESSKISVTVGKKQAKAKIYLLLLINDIDKLGLSHNSIH